MARVTRTMETADRNRAVELARRLVDCDEETRSKHVRSLLLERCLSDSVRDLNHLIDCPEHRELGLKALSCIGFDASA